MSTLSRADRAFCKALPKVELHAHFTGSISRQTLHEIWKRKKDAGELEGENALEDPLVSLPPAGDGINITTFFPLFTHNLYHLLTTPQDITTALNSVLQSFASDNVIHLELRTTPRSPSPSLSKEAYIALLLSLIATWNATPNQSMNVGLILSVDRRGTIQEAQETVALAIGHQGNGVVGVDLCGDPTRGTPSLFAPAFRQAKSAGLGVTLHFGEVSGAWVDGELEELLSWEPDRIGHVIHLGEEVKREVRKQGVGLELCVSCNTLAGMTGGGTGGHHFGEWWVRQEGRDRERTNAVALSTDDVGIFESELSNEYALVMEHFGLSRGEVLKLARAAGVMVFGGIEKVQRVLERLYWFEHGLEEYAGRPNATNI
ncbi:hypothetical protein KVT40_004822 [Elsinoe batatas]|uniref:Adenosine deaminase domain-containing protein n=1 Tax=Elsinoe batatas TaxID=2601811 RepID=A0A8K0L2N6_9PEZI|nr:hypothetical protein KVT40_004822 [Elsinoe batatas]